jgi:hypothetical protein
MRVRLNMVCSLVLAIALVTAAKAEGPWRSLFNGQTVIDNVELPGLRPGQRRLAGLPCPGSSATRCREPRRT